MPGRMTLAPSNASVWVTTAHDISQIMQSALMQTLSSLSCAHSCIAFVIPTYITIALVDRPVPLTEAESFIYF